MDSDGAGGDGVLQTLDRSVCLGLLRAESVGRIALVVDGDPIILPVNYRFVEPASGPLIAVRTRAGSVIDHAPTNVAFEIDSIDPVHHQGWSVLARGELLHAARSSSQFRERYDPESWLDDPESWLLIDPWAITGRALHGAEPVWPPRPGEYM